MDALIEAVKMTAELWVFLGILATALLVEEGIVAKNKKKLVDNPTLW